MRQHLNPDNLAKNPAFSQVVVVKNVPKVAYIGGQNAIDPNGKIVGKTLAQQTKQVLENVAAAAQAAGGDSHDIVKWTVYVVDGQPLQDGLAASDEAWGRSSPPPAISVIKVAGLANPEFLVEIEAIMAIDK